MSRLAQTLDTIRLEDGRPDVQTRRAELDSIICSLSSAEIRHVQGRLSALTLQKDICAELPVELLLYIAQSLDLEDVMRARCVSHRWKERFSSPDFCSGIVKLHFRPIWERQYKALEDSDQKLAKQSVAKWFPGAAMDRIRRSHGQYSSMSIYHYAWEEMLIPGQPIHNYQYNNRRIAFERDKMTVIVKSLRTGSSRSFVDDNRSRLSKWLLADDFLITCTLSHGATLFAWALDSNGNDDRYTVRLTGGISSISAHHNEVVVETWSKEVSIWTIGGSMQPVDTSNAKERLDKESFKRTTVFHPDGQGHFFVVYCTKQTGAIREGFQVRVLVEEYIHARSESVYELDLMCAEPLARIPDIVEIEEGVIGIVNAGELFYIATTAGDRYPACADKFRGGDQPLHEPSRRLVIEFNMYTKQFGFQCHHLPDSSVIERDTHELEHGLVWRDQLQVPIHFSGYVTTSGKSPGVQDMLVMGINPCGKVSDKERDVPWYGKNGTEDDKILFLPADGDFHRKAVAYCWVGGSGFAKEARVLFDDFRAGGALDTSRVVRGDDEFVVLFGKYGYVVWCFDKEVKLPISGTRLDGAILEDLRHPLSPF